MSPISCPLLISLLFETDARPGKLPDQRASADRHLEIEIQPILRMCADAMLTVSMRNKKGAFQRCSGPKKRVAAMLLRCRSNIMHGLSHEKRPKSIAFYYYLERLRSTRWEFVIKENYRKNHRRAKNVSMGSAARVLPSENSLGNAHSTTKV
jgi:hypothetical protein